MSLEQLLVACLQSVVVVWPCATVLSGDFRSSELRRVAVVGACHFFLLDISAPTYRARVLPWALSVLRTNRAAQSSNSCSTPSMGEQEANQN